MVGRKSIRTKIEGEDEINREKPAKARRKEAALGFGLGFALHTFI
jgi:hypothetical protein